MEAAKGNLHVNVGFYGGAIPGNIDDLDELLGSGVFENKAFLTHSASTNLERHRSEFMWKAPPHLEEAWSEAACSS
ncbi:MAG: hypothetical protein R2818_08980 [Flavobacteriales bacterium]